MYDVATAIEYQNNAANFARVARKFAEVGDKPAWEEYSSLAAYYATRARSIMGIK